jgi:hypothetical protein
MISFILHHIVFDPIRRFVLGIGGLLRWSFFQFLNISFEKKYPKNLECYLDYKNEIIDKNGFTIAQKNLFAWFVLFICFLIIIQN